MTIPTEERPTAAPPVVAVMVVHEPGDWFGEVLTGLLAQDYPDLRVVTLLTGTTPPSMGEEIRRRLPSALVRSVEGNPGFGPVVNQVMSLVDGRDGFFLVLHDDVALRPNTVSSLVEEAIRSNAALVGPKLVEWDAPDVLQHVGLDSDRTGQLVDVVDPGERDQEQHDAVRDVFALPSACLLIRNDVFREISGFSPNIPFLGEELDLCWRVHLLGARVIVDPAAVVRHRGAFVARATLVRAANRIERHRVRTALTCASVTHLPALIARLVVGALLDVVFGLFSGRQHDLLASARAVAAIPVDLPLIIERRSMLRAFRRVPGREVASLQLRGSARLAAYTRHRRALREQSTSEIPTLGPTPAPVARTATLIGIAAVALLIVANRGLIWGGLSGVGQAMPLMPADASPLDAARMYMAGWSPGWFGTSGAAPTYLGVMAVLGAVAFGNWAGLLTAIFVGGFFVAAIGVWRLCGAIGGTRARMFGALVYVALPVGILAVRDGRRDAMIVWALLPWIVDFARRIAGLARDEHGSIREASIRSVGSRRAQLIASLLLLVAGAAAFSPATLIVTSLVAALLTMASLFTPTPWRASAWLVAAPLGAVLGAVVLHVPWSVRFIDGDWWASIVGPSRVATGASLVDVLSFGVDNVVWRTMIVAAYLPVVVMLLATRGARSAWPIRASLLVAVPILLQLSTERGLLDVRFPESLMLASISALGVVIAATAAFESMIVGRRASFSWRQMLAIVAVAAVGVAVTPSLVATGSGRWSQPEDTLGRLIGQLPSDRDGDYAVLYIGDPRLLPSAVVDAGDGFAYGVLRDGGATGVDTLAATPSTMTIALDRAVRVLVTGESLRAGRLLSPLAVRYVVVPLRDATSYARRQPLTGDIGPNLVARMSDQLDFRRLYTATDLVIFENMAALPTVSVLSERSAVSSKSATEANLLAESLTTRGGFIVGFGPERANIAELLAGSVHLALPYSDRWTLRVDGAQIAPRVAFGTTTAFDAPVAGSATLRLAGSLSHRLLVSLQLVLWLMVLAITFNPSRFRGRVRAAREVVEVSLRGDDQRSLSP